MKDIFELQWQLNAHTLKKIGLDYGFTIRDPEGKSLWIENYRKALSAELAELIRDVQAFGIGSQNGRVEIVDMLHFLVSLSHIVELTPEEAMESAFPEGQDFASLSIRTFLGLDELQNSVKWKWWAKGGGFKEEKARAAVIELWKCFHGWCSLFEMRPDAVKALYVAKNEVNFRRQEEGYNEDTKTEADNQALGI